MSTSSNVYSFFFFMGCAWSMVVSLGCYVFVSVSGMHLYVTVLCFCVSMYDEHLYTGQCCVHGTVVFMYLFLSGYCYASVCDNSVFVCVFSGGSPHESPRNLSPNQHVSFAFQAIRKSVFSCVPVFNDVIL